MTGRTDRQLALLPDDPPRWGGPDAVTADPIVTSGRIEYTVRCDGPGGCGHHHRHTGPGVRRGPCGAQYTVPGGQAAEAIDTS
ncbi:hypothetical protein [Streptomyces graminilatus]|uniref:hypothetical protein n=1 Tax=Streptomyces graminilatus TaxID=1464070 RepID=UPI0006E45BF0|nr:hypothetical protein [Streptomyces graminilatus]